MRVDAPQTERAPAVGRMIRRLLRSVVLRRRENAVVGADRRGQFSVNREVLDAENGIRPDDLAETVDDLILGAPLHHHVEVAAIEALRLQGLQRRERAAAPAPSGEAADRHVDASDHPRQEIRRAMPLV